MATRTASLVRVHTGSGTKRIECETDATIKDVKIKLENLFAYPVHRQILSYSPPSGPSRAVEDSVRLQDLDTRNGFLRLQVIGAPQETQHRFTPTTSNKIDQARASREATIHAGDKKSRIGDSNLLEFVQDARRFCLRQSSMITEAPLQVYVSALLFSPRQSIVKRQFIDKGLQWITIKPHVEDYWNPCLATVVVDRYSKDKVELVTLSPDGRLIASMSNFRHFDIWRAETGALQVRLEENDNVESVQFSPCGKRIATRSLDKISLWCIETGSCQMTFDPQGSPIYSIVVLPDGAHIALALGYVGNIEIRDIPTRECLPTIRIRRDSSNLRTTWAERGGVTRASFSPNGQVLAVRSQNIQLWDTCTGVCQTTLNTDADFIHSVVFSEDGSYIAAISQDGAVELWDLQTGASQQMCRNHGGSVLAVAFSPDGKYLASGSSDFNVCLWDLYTGSCLGTLAGHDGLVNCVAFSPDSQRLVSGSGDSTFRIWDLKESSNQTEIKDRNGIVEVIVFSPDGRKLAYTSWEKEGGGGVSLLDIETGKHQKVAHFKGYWGYKGVSFHSTGKYVGTKDKDNTFGHVWDISDNPSEKPLEDQGMHEEEYTSYYPKVRLEVLPPEDQHLTTAILDASVANCGLSNDGRWITYRGQSKILLPFDYERPEQWESRDNMIAIARKQGDVIIIGFGDNVP